MALFAYRSRLAQAKRNPEAIDFYILKKHASHTVHMITTTLIPKQRISILIGKDGGAKKRIEEKTNTKIFINDEIIIEGEPLDVITAENIIKAIGRGFEPAKALELLDEDMVLHIIHLPKNENELRRIKSRIIGTNGRAKRNVERLTDTCISVYGKTVAIIGSYEGAEIAGAALKKLIAGSTHSTVYRFLESHKHA